MDVSQKQNLYAEYFQLTQYIKNYYLTGLYKPYCVKINRDKISIDPISELNKNIISCRKCQNLPAIINPAVGLGDIKAKLMIIGMKPGSGMDNLSRSSPFNGEAGDYLSKWLASIDIHLADTFRTHILKCEYESDNINPEQIKACMQYLQNEIKTIQPKAIMNLDKNVTRQMIHNMQCITQNQKKQYFYQQIPIFSFFHPLAVLKDPSKKREVWEKLKLIKSIIDNQ